MLGERNFQTGSGALPTSCSVGTKGGVKRPGHETDRPVVVPLLGVREATVFLHAPNMHSWHAKGQA